MKKIIKMSDGIVTPDQLFVNSESHKPGFDTKVIITAKNCLHDGSKETQIVSNKTVLPGRTHLLESIFPITPDIENQHLFLNDNVLGEFDPVTGRPVANPTKAGAVTDPNKLPRSNIALFRRRKVQYWCAGDGAMNKTVISQSYPSHSTNTRLYHMIPFRFIKSDQAISATEEQMYKFKVTYGSNSPYFGYIGYYLKRIDFVKTNGINSEVDKVPYSPMSWGDTAVDLNAETAGYQNKFKGDKTHSNYIDMRMNIDSKEFKEWFTYTDGTLANATISELGLVLGLDCYVSNPQQSNPTFDIIEDLNPNLEGYNDKKIRSEVYDAELFAHLTFDPYKVSRENALIDFEYRIYS